MKWEVLINRNFCFCINLQSNQHFWWNVRKEEEKDCDDDDDDEQH